MCCFICAVSRDLLRYIDEKGLKPAPVPEIPLPAGIPKASAPPPQPTMAPQPTASPVIPPSPPAPLPSESEAFEDIPLTNMRSIIARRLTESKVGVPYNSSLVTVYSI